MSAVAIGANAAAPQLYFDRPADFFEETFVIGNGTQGAIIYGNPDRERLSLNDITFWTGEPDNTVYSPGAYKHIPAIREALDADNYELAEKLQQEVQGKYTNNYQPIGNLFIDFDNKGNASGYKRTLNLEDATARVSYSKDGNPITTEYIASAPDSLIAVKITAERPIGFTLSFESPIKGVKVESSGHGIIAEGRAAAASIPSYVKLPDNEKMIYQEGHGIQFQTQVRVISDGAKVTASDGKLKVADCQDATIIIAIATSFNGPRTNPDTDGRDFRAIATRLADSGEKKHMNRSAEIISQTIPDSSRAPKSTWENRIPN